MTRARLWLCRVLSRILRKTCGGPAPALAATLSSNLVQRVEEEALRYEEANRVLVEGLETIITEAKASDMLPIELLMTRIAGRPVKLARRAD